MATKKPQRESEIESRRASISENASDWMQQFVKFFELNFFDASRSLPPEAHSHDYQDAAIRAIFQTLLDSGMSAESVIETVAQVAIERRPGGIKWSSELNRRRFELIDKEIQQTLTPAERIELAGLTRVMREQLESEANLPLEGGKALHRKLLELDATKRLG